MERSMSKELKDKIEADYRAKRLTVAEIAEKHDVSSQSVLNVAKERKAPLRFPKFTDDQKHEMVRLYTKENWPSPKIAERFGCSAKGVRDVIHAAGGEIVVGAHHRAFDEARERQFVERCSEVSVAQASSEFGITMQGGYKILKRNGVKVRSNSDRVTRHGTDHGSMGR